MTWWITTEMFAAHCGYYSYSVISSEFILLLFPLSICCYLDIQIIPQRQDKCLILFVCACILLLFLFFVCKSISNIMNWCHSNFQCWQWFLSLLSDAQWLSEILLKIPFTAGSSLLRVCFYWWFLNSSILSFSYILQSMFIHFIG